MSRPAIAALALCALLVGACGSREPRLERLPRAEMRDILPPPSLEGASEPAPAPAGPPAAVAGEAQAESVPARAAASEELPPSPPEDDERPQPSAGAIGVDEVGWPRSFAASGVAFELYQPQVESWDGSTLVADALVVAQPQGDQAALGAVRMTARTIKDNPATSATLEELTLSQARFPTALDREQAWLGLLRSFAPRSIKRLALAHLEAGAARAEALEQAHAVARSAAPRIIVARNPALLVAIDGAPRFVPVPGTQLSGVRNTRAVLLRDGAGKLFLHVYDGWVTAASLRGPWMAAKAPPGAEVALAAAQANGRANLLAGRPGAKNGKRPTLSSEKVPVIVVSAQPAVLVGVNGEPKFASIAGTNLQYVSNTSAHVFRHAKSQKLYVLALGRWFAARSLRGPFELTAVDKLPADFARISADGPKGSVLPFVSRTMGAAAPAPERTLPTIVGVAREQARFDGVIDGEPKLEPIAGTQLNYVANASAPIIQVDSNHWYGSHNGIWFAAASPAGPWSLTDDVPAAIYAIPPSSPVYHAVHSRPYASTSDTVYFGYQPDYFRVTDGPVGVGDVGGDYQVSPPPGLTWGWFY